MGTVRLRKALVDAGLVPETSEKPAAWEMFDADAAEALVRPMLDGLGWTEVIERFNFPRDQLEVMIKAGFITPLPTGEATYPSFHPAEIQGFLDRLLRGAVATTQAKPDYHDIPAACRRLVCSARQIVALILDGRLKKICRHTEREGYLAVLVNVREIRPRLVRASASGLIVEQAAERLGVANLDDLVVIGTTQYRVTENGLWLETLCALRLRKFLDFAALEKLRKSPDDRVIKGYFGRLHGEPQPINYSILARLTQNEIEKLNDSVAMTEWPLEKERAGEMTRSDNSMKAQLPALNAHMAAFYKAGRATNHRTKRTVYDLPSLKTLRKMMIAYSEAGHDLLALIPKKVRRPSARRLDLKAVEILRRTVKTQYMTASAFRRAMCFWRWSAPSMPKTPAGCNAEKKRSLTPACGRSTAKSTSSIRSTLTPHAMAKSPRRTSSRSPTRV